MNYDRLGSASSAEVPKPHLYKAIGYAFDPLLRARGGMSVSGEDNLVDNHQGQIFAFNHKSNWDPIYVGRMGLKFDLEFYNLAKIEIFKNARFAQLLHNIGGIAFDRPKSLYDQPAGNQLGRVLETGGNAVLYLEGHRFPEEDFGPMDKVGALAVRKNAIVYPAAIAGTNQKFGHVHIAIGSPYNIEGTGAAQRRIEIVREIDEHIPHDIKQLYKTAKQKSGVKRIFF